MIGRREALEAALGATPAQAVGGLRHLLALDAALGPGERSHVVYDLGEVRGLDYYTGVHFEVFVSGAGRAAGAGGRYDELMGRFGRPMPAVGVSHRSRRHRRGAAVSRLRVALAKGRLFEPSVERFRAAGIDPAGRCGPASAHPVERSGIEFLVVKPADVPVYVESGAADLGITGTDVLRETGADVLEPLELGFGYCRLVVASPAQERYPRLEAGSRPASRPSTRGWPQAHFAAAGRPVDIIQVNGSVEVAPLLRLSHWIVDLVDTGIRCARTGWWSGRRSSNAGPCWWPIGRARS